MVDLNNQTEIEQLRKSMLHFACRQLGTESVAEDVVQEALVSAFEYQHAFTGQASFKTWVFAILKNKIIDYLRQQGRTVAMSDLYDNYQEIEQTQEQYFENLFESSGHWSPTFRLQRWENPEEWLENQAFWRVFNDCVNHLPANQAQVFMLREVIGLSTDEICEKLQLSIANVNTMMYRSRMKLRQCLENNWILE